MHSRRLGSFLIGVWLMGTVLIWFVKSQTVREVERFSTASVNAEKEIAAAGKENAERILHDFAVLYNRRLQETWETVQLCVGAGLFLTSLITPVRSRTVLISTAAMIALVAVMAFYVTPSLITLQTRLDLSGGSSEVRTEDLVSLRVWHRLLEILKIGLGILIAIRLLFDLHGLGLPFGSSAPRQRRSEGTGVSPSHAKARQ